MAIIFSEDGKTTKKLDEIHFGLEDKLQDYVKQNPDIVPIYEIDEDARLLVLSREFSTNSGPIDALGVDQSGNVYVIETKLYKNADKRTVLAQALDYGASLWRSSKDKSELTQKLNAAVNKQFSVSLDDKLQDFFELDDSTDLIDSITDNVMNGVIKFVILMDQVDDRLKDLVTYVNQNSKFDIYAVDLEYYKHDRFEIVIPKLYGSEVKKTVGRSDDNKFDNQKILDWIQEFSIDNLSVNMDATTKSYIRLTSNSLDTIMPPRDEHDNSWNSNTAYFYEIQTSASGWIKVMLVLNSKGANSEQQKGHQQVIKKSRRNPKENWIYFVANSWNVNVDNGESGIKQDIEKIFTQLIPEYEKNILGR